MNFIALLGWTPPKDVATDHLTIERLSQLFSLQSVHRSPAIVNLDHLKWLNKQYTHRLTESTAGRTRLAAQLRAALQQAPYFAKLPLSLMTDAYLLAVVDAMKARSSAAPRCGARILTSIRSCC